MMSDEMKSAVGTRTFAPEATKTDRQEFWSERVANELATICEELIETRAVLRRKADQLQGHEPEDEGRDKGAAEEVLPGMDLINDRIAAVREMARDVRKQANRFSEI